MDEEKKKCGLYMRVSTEDQAREDRKIENYFKKVCESQNDIVCEIIIKLGDMDFWNDKDEKYR